LQAGGRGFESRRLHQPNKINGFRDIGPLERPQKADAHPETGFQAALEAFLLTRRVSNCSPRTVNGYAGAIQRFAQTLALHDLSDATSLGIQRYLSGLRETMKPISVHDYFRPLKTFFRWCIEAGLLQDNPVRGITVRVPRTLPRVPEDDDVRRLIQACPPTFEGRRNRALVALLADSGLRISEALRLRIEDVNFSTRTLDVRGGKGGKDGVGFFGAEAAQMLRAWLGARREATPEDHLFVDRMGRSLGRTVTFNALPIGVGDDELDDGRWIRTTRPKRVCNPWIHRHYQVKRRYVD
jgi:site-specific recombinase XerD